MTFDTSAVPNLVRLTVGDVEVIDVPTFAGGGYEWSVAAESGAGVADLVLEVGDVGAATEGGEGGDGGEPPAMFLAPERLRIHALAPGSGRWRLLLARPFEPTAAAEVELRVEVEPRRAAG